MSVRFFSGKPGAGKSLMAMYSLEEELKSTTRFIVTNLSVKIPELCEYLHKKYGQTFGAHERIRILKDEEVGVFWTFYGPGFPVLEGRVSMLVHGKRQEHVDFSPRVHHEGQYRGVLYILDEIHEHFNARRWAETGVDAIHYLSQHRKLGDDLICITQHVENVDKQFRSVCQDYTVLRNLRREQMPVLGGIFKAPQMIVYSVYLNPPGNGKQPPMRTGTVRIDKKGLAACYDTAAGVGLRGTTADTNTTSKGIPVIWLFVAMVAIGASIILFGKGVTKGLRSTLGGELGDGSVAVEVIPSHSVVASTNAGLALPVTVQATNQPPPEVVITSVSVLGPSVRVGLSDGRTLTERDITSISRNWVFAGEERFRPKGGGVIGIPGMKRSPVATTHPYPVRDLRAPNSPAAAVEQEGMSTGVESKPGSALIPVDLRTQWSSADAGAINLPIRGLAVP